MSGFDGVSGPSQPQPQIPRFKTNQLQIVHSLPATYTEGCPGTEVMNGDRISGFFSPLKEYRNTPFIRIGEITH